MSFTKMQVFGMNNDHLCHHLLLLLFLCLAVFIFQSEAQALNKSVPAIFVFGDSTSDPGNNNFIYTPFKGNFLPYGQDFANHVPTGRFTNGRLSNDYIAEYVGVKDYVPPYLDPNLNMQDLMTGVSFASAGSGFDPLTPQISNVISLSTQLEYFKEYKTRMAAEIGVEKTEQMIQNSLFIVSAGTNDFIVNYFTLPIRRKNYTVPAYTDFCLQRSQLFMQELLDLGARRIGVAGLPPMGCLPIVITLYSNNAFKNRGCVQRFSDIAQIYNQKLQAQLNSLHEKRTDLGLRIGYFDVYKIVYDMTTQTHNYGFEEVYSGCCGTGLLEASISCNPRSYVCPDTSKYLYWDSIHPTEKAYSIISKAIQPVIDSIIHH